MCVQKADTVSDKRTHANAYATYAVCMVAYTRGTLLCVVASLATPRLPVSINTADIVQSVYGRRLPPVDEKCDPGRISFRQPQGAKGSSTYCVYQVPT